MTDKWETTKQMEENSIRKQREIQEETETEPKYNHSFHFRSCEHMRCLTPTPRVTSGLWDLNKNIPAETPK